MKRLCMLIGVSLLGGLAFLVTLASLSQPALALTPPPGCASITADIVANTTWSAPCYRIATSTVAVQAGAWLTIQPGVEVYFDRGARLQINQGAGLTAVGSAASPIRFTSAMTTGMEARCDWEGIIINSESGPDGVRIQHAIIEYACTGISSGGRQYMTITDNLFRHNGIGSSGGGASGGAIGGDTDHSEIARNTIHHCARGIVLNESYSNEIYDNVIHDVDRYGIALAAGVTAGGEWNTITNNRIYNCGADGIRLEGGRYNHVTANTITRTMLSGAAPGAAIYLSDQAYSRVQSNQLDDNGGGAGYQAAIYATGGSWLVNAWYNVIRDARAEGIEFAPGSGVAGGYSVAYNALCSLVSFELENRTPTSTIAAPGNWWGTNTPMSGVNYSGPVNPSPWITLSLTTVPTMVANLGSAVNVQVTMRDGAGNTVPPAARQVQLSASHGTISPPVVTLDATGQANATFTLTSLPPGGHVTLSARAFCDFIATAQIAIERTNLAIAKTVGVTQVIGGQQITYRIAYSNTSGAEASAVRITDTLPAGTTWLADTASGWARTVAGSQVIWTRAALPGGASGSFDVTVAVPAGAPCGQLLTNQVAIGTSTAETTLADNSASAGPVTVIQPGVTINKGGSLLSHPGAPVAYTFQITNTSCPAGSPPLLLDSIADTLLGNLATAATNAGCHTLAAGAVCTFTLQRTVLPTDPDPLPNTVVVHYHPQGFSGYDVTASDSHVVQLFQPAIRIFKDGTALSKAGDVATYTFQIVNESSTDSPPLLVLSVNDVGAGWPGLGDLSSIAILGGCDLLLPLRECRFTVTRTVQSSDPDPLMNTVTARYRPAGFTTNITATDSHTINLFQPSIAFSKSGDLLSKVGDTVNYTLRLTNTSSSDSPNLVCRLSDPLLGIDQNITLPPGGVYVMNPAYVTPAGAPDPLVNLAYVRCSPAGFPNVLIASASHTVNLFQPGVALQLSGDTLSKATDPVTYTVRITNTSSADSPNLILDSLVDSVLGDLFTTARNHGCDPLPPGAFCQFTLRRTVLAGDPDPLLHTLTVHYHPQGFPNDITATDGHVVELFQPRVAVDKSGPALSKVGDPAIYTIAITHTGSADSPALILDSIVDTGVGWAGLGDLAAAARAAGCDGLAPGGSCRFTVQHIVQPGDPDPLTDVVIVHYHPLGFPNDVMGADSHTVNLFTPAVEVIKSGSSLSKVGDGVTWNFRIVNRSSGDSPDLILDSIADVGAGWPGVPLPNPLPAACRRLAAGADCSFSVPYTIPVGAPDPLTNTVTVHYHPEGFPNDITDSDDHIIQLFQPSIAVDKRGPAWVWVRDTIIYTFVVTNTSSWDTPILILDSAPDVGSGWSGLGNLSGAAGAAGCGALAPGAVCSFTVTYTVNSCASPALTNTVTFHYHPLGFPNDIAASDTHTVRVVCPVDLETIKDDEIGPSLPRQPRRPVTVRLFDRSGLAPAAPTQHRDFIGPGDLITYTVDVFNNEQMTATHVVLTETLPLYTTYVGYGWTPVGGGATRLYTLTLGELPPYSGARVYFVVRVDDPLPPGLGDIINDRVCAISDQIERNYANNCALEDSPVRWARLSLTKTVEAPLSGHGAGAPPVLPDRPVTFTIALANLGQALGSGGLSGVTLTDALPAGFTWVGDTAPAAGLIRLSTHPPIWYLPALTVSERISFTLIAQAPAEFTTAECMTIVSNTVTATVSLGNTLYQRTAQAGVERFCRPDLFVTKHDDVERGAAPRAPLELSSAPKRALVESLLAQAAAHAPLQTREFVFPGDLVTYTITVINTGPYTATDVVLTETLPLYTSYVGYGWTPAAGGIPGRTFRMDVATIPPQGWVITYFVVRVDDNVPAGLDSLLNYVCGDNARGDLDFSDNCRYEDTPLAQRPSITKTSAPVANAGELFTFTISYANPNATPLSGLRITDTLPPDGIWVSDTAPAAGWTRESVGGGRVVWTMPNLPAGASGSFVLSLVISPTHTAVCSATLTNAVTLTLLNHGERYFAAADAARFRLNCQVDLVIQIDDLFGPGTRRPAAPAQPPPFAQPGNLITYTLTVINRGWTTATGVVLSETLPLYTTYVGYGWTQVGGRIFTLPLPDLPRGASATAQFVVRVDNPLPAGVTSIANYACVHSREPDGNEVDNCAWQYTPVASVSVTKTVHPARILAGEQVIYTIVVTGADRLAALGATGNLTVTDVLPAGFTPLPPGQPLTWHIPAATAPAILSLSFTARSPAFAACGAWTNTVTLSATIGGHVYGWPAAASVWIECPMDLLLIKDDDVGLEDYRPFVREGDLITYTIAVINNGLNSIHGIVLTETLPLYTDYVGYGWTHVGGRTYRLAIGDLPAGAARTYLFVVRVQDWVPGDVEVLLNRVCGAGSEPDFYPANNCNDEDTPLRRRPLQVSKTAQPCISAGDVIDYRITYRNTTTDTTFANVVISDTLDEYATYVGGAGWTCVGRQCTRSVPPLPPGASGVLTLSAQLSIFLPITRTAVTNTVSIADAAYPGAGNRFTLVTPVDAGPDLVIVKNDNVGPTPPGFPPQRERVRPGERITYTIIYVNNGRDAATNVVLTETLPLSTTYAGDASWQHVGGRLYRRVVGDLAAGAGGLVNFVVRVNDPFIFAGSGAPYVLNLVEIGSLTPECDTANNWSTDHTPIDVAAAVRLQLSKTAPLTVCQNGFISYTIVAVNSGGPVAGVTLSDSVPNGATFVPGSCRYQRNGGAWQPCTLPNVWQLDLSAGERVTTTFRVQATGGSMGFAVDNTALLQWSGGTVSASARTIVQQCVALSVLKLAPAALCQDSVISYTVVAVNSGPAMTGVALYDPIPNGTSYVIGSCSYTRSSTGLSYPCSMPNVWLLDLAAGERVTTTFALRHTGGSMGIHTVTNEAYLRWSGGERSAQTVTQMVPCLTLAKSAPVLACENGPITYTIVAANNQAGVAITGVSLVDPLPNNTTYRPGSCRYSVNGGAWQPCGPPPALWSGFSLQPGDRITTTFVVTAASGSMGVPVINRAYLRWPGMELQASASTNLARCNLRLYVADWYSHTIQIYDAETFLHLGTITVPPGGTNLFGMVIANNRLFVADYNDNRHAGLLHDINLLFDNPIASYNVVGAHAIHVTALDGYIYVASHSGAPAITVVGMDGYIATTFSLNRHLTYEFGMFGATADPRRGRVYMTKRDMGGVGIWRITPPQPGGRWISDCSVRGGPLDSRCEFVYATDESRGEKPSSILYHAGTDRVYVTFGLINEVWVFNPDSWVVEARLPTGVQDPVNPGFGGHGLTSLGQCIFVSNYEGRSLTAVIHGSCVESGMAGPVSESRIYLPLVGRNFVVTPTGTLILPSPPVAALAPQQTLRTIPLGGRPLGIVAGSGHYIYVTLPRERETTLNGVTWTVPMNPANEIVVIDTRTWAIVARFSVPGRGAHTVILGGRVNPRRLPQSGGTLILPEPE